KNGGLDDLSSWSSYGTSTSSLKRVGLGTSAYINRPYLSTYYLYQNIQGSVSLESQVSFQAWVYPLRTGGASSYNYAGIQIQFRSGSTYRYLLYTWLGNPSGSSSIKVINLDGNSPIFRSYSWNFVYRNLKEDFEANFGISGDSYSVTQIQGLIRHSIGSNSLLQPFYLDSVGLYKSIVKNSGFENGISDWTILDGTPSYINSPASLTVDGDNAGYFPERIAPSTIYNHRLYQSFPTNSYQLTPGTSLWTYVYPTVVQNFPGVTWPYSAIYVQFTNYDNTIGRGFYYIWAGNLNPSTTQFTLYDQWTPNQWNLLYRDLYEDFKVKFPADNPEDFSITYIRPGYHYSNQNPGIFYIDNLDISPGPDRSGPLFTSVPLDRTIDEMTTGNTLSWEATDNNPGAYTILRGSTTISTGSWTRYSPVTINFDGLFPGVYTYTAYFYDSLGNVKTDEVEVTVITTDTEPPIINNFYTDPSNGSIDETSYVTIKADLQDNEALDNNSQIASYFYNSVWTNTSLTYTGISGIGQIYQSGSLGPFTKGSTIVYKIYSKDIANLWTVSTNKSFYIKDSDNIQPSITNPVVSPDLPLDTDLFVISTTISDGSGIALALIHYSLNG
ncbi:MAG: hypothetical protein ACC656_05160, partial [Candidatus Heimdallarchaeota archaeon]